ncbi:ATP-dependent helicase [Inhella sp.]|uniref:ATP-dependent helicase n=1 Tax=Inhella sp. TaxID=1921806 RepID=UPI0035ADAB04
MAAGLNPAQMQAVNHVATPCLVLAGAGSGKTRVITQKIVRLLQLGLQPGQIAAITFTNKAAQEMRERARELVGGKAAGQLMISTFHALGVRFLREEGPQLHLKPQFSILDADDALNLIRDCAPTTDVRLPKLWQRQISLWKNEGMDAAAATAAAESDMERQAAAVFQQYGERLAAYQAVDFDDLIGLPLHLLGTNAEVAARWQARFRHVLIDEVQDTNAVQYALLKALVGKQGLFTAVGDDDQSIYGWRGATLENLKSLQTDYPNLQVIALEQNYRSTSAILRAANHVIASNPKLFDKKLWSDLGEGEPINVLACDDEMHEAERAVQRLKQRKEQDGAQGRWSDCAILYRANHQAKVFEQALRRAQIPYKVSGGTSFFDRAEIRDLCAWLRLLVNEDDDPAFLRAISTPKRGIGHTTLAALGAFAGAHKLSLHAALGSPGLTGSLSKRQLDALHDFGREVQTLRERAARAVGQTAAHSLCMDWLRDMAYEAHLQSGDDSEKAAANRWANVLDFIDWMAKRCAGDELDRTERSLLDVAQTINVIVSLMERGEQQDQLVLSTLHAAKGLEWPHVVLVGINEGLLPFATDDDPITPERLAEERRLMYVGITRARRSLAVSWLRRRKKGRETVAGRASRFVEEMRLDEGGPLRDARADFKALRERLAKRASGNQG